MDSELIEYLNRINLYERVIVNNDLQDKNGGDLLLEAMGLSPLEIMEDFNVICDNTIEHISLLKLFKKTKLKNEKIEIKNNIKKVMQDQHNNIINIKKKVISTGFVTSLKELEDPNLFGRIMDKDSLSVAHYQHSRVFNKTLQIVSGNEELVRLFDAELSKVNLSFKLVKALNNAILKRDQELYTKVQRIFQRDFSKLGSVLYKNLGRSVESCLRTKKHLNETHEYFDIVKANVAHPEIYISKAILSKTLNKLN